jgi:hypothetical protein
MTDERFTAAKSGPGRNGNRTANRRPLPRHHLPIGARIGRVFYTSARGTGRRYRLMATPHQISSTTPKGQAPDKKP